MGAEGLGGQAEVDRVRAFFGLPLPEGHRRQLAPYLSACAAAATAFRWGGPDNLHLTLRFIGSVERARAEGIASGLQLDPGPAFDVSLGDTGAFSRGGLARVVWIGVRDGVEPLGRLAARVEALCAQAGLEPERRPFNAHLTLARARAREGAPLPDLPQPPALPSWRAGEVILYASHLGRGGAVHEPIRTIALRE